MWRYLARQPILNLREETFGYELLYRAAAENFARIDDFNHAARTVLESLFSFGLEELGRGRRLFLNCTHECLTQDFVRLVPKETVVLEILETVIPDHDLLQSCAELKRAGYSVALDDFLPGPTTLPLVPFADYIKVDVRALSFEQCRAIVQQFGHGVQFVAEKVETRTEYLACRDIGCRFFQGYFFAQPSLLTIRDIPAVHLNAVRLLAATCKPDFHFGEIEQIIKTDVALTYKLLRFLNSAAFCLGSEITSLRQGLISLGEDLLRRWIAVTAVTAATSAIDRKPPELLVSALVRARFCERLAGMTHCNPYEGFLVGLFSLLSPMLDMPLEHILGQIELPSATRAALLGTDGPLRTLFELACAYMEGNWDRMHARAEELALPQPQVASCYLEAVRSADALIAIL